MANVYGAALGGIRLYGDYITQRSERMLELQKDRISDDPARVQRAAMEAELMLSSITYARGVAELLLKIIQPIN